MRFLLVGLFVFFNGAVYGQTATSVIDSFHIYSDIKVTVDRPTDLSSNSKTIITFFALPNGNTTSQTMGKKMLPGDDWHFDIQHIAAQTKFIRQQVNVNFIVIYLENDYKSWPSWKQKHTDFRKQIPHIVDSLAKVYGSRKCEIYLNGHSGGGSFIFGYLAGVGQVPKQVKRISFLDSNYGYDSTYYPILSNWLKNVKGATLNVFAYNDSVALYNGKPVVSATGGTWYKGHLLLKDLQVDYSFSKMITDSLIIYKSTKNKVQFYFKQNLNHGIYHTQQVELNGFIHSILCGTKRDSKEYIYYGKRAYADLIE